MAFDHYVAICDPFHYVTTMSHHRCVLLDHGDSQPNQQCLQVHPPGTLLRLEDQKLHFALFFIMYIIVVGNLLIILAISSRHPWAQCTNLCTLKGTVGHEAAVGPSSMPPPGPSHCSPSPCLLAAPLLVPLLPRADGADPTCTR
ncbi:hypothetical protein QTO34_005198 [Cnephaeus nilssonii]|uniref:G-protein coupled receptors family 1 profile domain-containing protein n=1 Tax=Cnephaeus nilssonii TaxID=3371016 RepID=A0AA40LJT1_CNENI|nr:hypothetical protein QTO34_005198 [Eptesicus nilssonii]